MDINTSIIELADSASVYKPFWLCWHYLGVTKWPKKDLINIVYDILINILIIFWYPMHYTLGLFLVPKENEIFKQLCASTTCIVASLKHCCLRWKLKEITEIIELFQQLDKRAISIEERKYFSTNSMRTGKVMAKIYFIACMSANVIDIIGTLMDKDKRLMHTGWFPFDWQSSTSLYYLAFLYQCLGATILIAHNFISDSIVPVTLCLFTGHVHLLAMRVANIGYDEKRTPKENEEELQFCIEDHITLIRLFKIVENAFSYSQLILFISSGLNICVVIIYLFFFADNLSEYIYYAVFAAAIGVELFPIYYYGSLLQQEFYDLPYAVFSSNWYAQSKCFRQNILIFGEVALRKSTLMAGGFVGIHLESLFAIYKMAYSLFAVFIRD